MQENINNGEDLIEKLRQATQDKLPGTNPAANAWDFDDEETSDQVSPTQGPSSTDSAAEKNGEGKPQKTESKPVLTAEQRKKEIEGSAEGATTFYDAFGSLIFDSIVRIRHWNKFTPEERETLKAGNIIDAEIEDLSGDDLTLRKKYDRIEKSKNRKLKEVEISEDRRKRFYNAMYKYYEVTGKSAGPELIIVGAITDAVVNGAIEAFTD
jgi:hypothetical protein